jgi:DNA primase
MPGIDFAAVRAAVSLQDVLNLIEFRPVRRNQRGLRGLCPFHCGGSPRDFAAYLETNSYYCFSCRRGGNQLELWARLQRLRLYDAALDLCQRLHIEVPFIHRW